VIRVTNGEDVKKFNDPSDVGDYFIGVLGLPKNIFIKKQPDIGFSWDTLPWRFGWDENFYVVEKI